MSIKNVPEDQPYVPTTAELTAFRARTELGINECRRLLTIARGDQDKAIMVLREERLKQHFGRPGATDMIW